MIHHSRQISSVGEGADPVPVRQSAVRATFGKGEGPCFDVYRTEQVRLTSTLFGGGDWHWRLTSGSGDVLADCGGYRNQRDCLAAAQAVHAAAGLANFSGSRDPLPS